MEGKKEGVKLKDILGKYWDMGDKVKKAVLLNEAEVCLFM